MEAKSPLAIVFRGKKYSPGNPGQLTPPQPNSTVVIVNSFAIKEQLRRKGYKFSDRTVCGTGWVKNVPPEVLDRELSELKAMGIDNEAYEPETHQATR